MSSWLVLAVTFTVNAFEIGASSPFGSWDRWPAKGWGAAASYGFGGDVLGFDLGLAGGSMSFTKETKGFSFGRVAGELKPSLYLSPAFPLRIGPVADYNVLFGSFSEQGDTNTYKLKTLFLPGYGAAVGFDYLLTKRLSLGVDLQYMTIYNFKNLSLWSLGLTVGFPSYQEPRLYATAEFDDSEGNGNGSLDAGERVHVNIEVRNAGAGPARSVAVKLESGSTEYQSRVVGIPGTYSIPYIRPGRTAKVRAEVRANANLPPGTMRLNVSGRERFGYEFEKAVSVSTRRGEKPYLVVEAAKFDDSEDGIFDAGEGVGFELTVNNKAAGEAYKVRAFVVNDVGDTLASQYLDNVPPSSFKQARLSFQMPMEVVTGTSTYRVGVTEASGYAAEPVTQIVQTRKLMAVALVPEATIDDDDRGASKGNGNGAVDKGEQVELKLTIRNAGVGTARDVRARVSCGQPGVEILTPEQQIGNLTASQDRAACLVFAVKQDFVGEEVALRLSLTEATAKFDRSVSLKYRLGERPVGPGPKGPVRENTYALVVGVSRYEDQTLEPLRYAERDADDLARVLEENGVSKVWRLLGKEATLKNIRVKLSELERVAGPGSLVYVFFSGHGGPATVNDKRGPYLLPYDVDRASLTNIQVSSLSWSDINEFLRNVGAEGALFAVNACYSTNPEGAAGVGAMEPIRRELPKSRVILSAARWDQPAYELPEYQHSIFAHRLIQALNGDAPGLATDGVVRVRETFDWVQAKVNADALDKKSTPQNPQITGEGDFEIVKVQK